MSIFLLIPSSKKAAGQQKNVIGIIMLKHPQYGKIPQGAPAAADLKAGVREKAAFLYIHGHFTFGKGMPHTFAMDYALYPEAENAMNEILTFISNVLDLR